MSPFRAPSRGAGARLALAAALTGNLACGPERIDLVGAYPPGTGRVAAVLVGAEGEVVGATGLVPLAREAATARVREEAAAERAFVFAWPEATLAPLFPPGAAIEEIPLAFARASEPVLPEAAWVGIAAPPGGPLEPAAPPAGLTASWLPPCPELVDADEEIVVDLRCASLPCQLRFEQRQCVINLPLGACGLPTLTAAIGGRGEIRVAGEPGGPVCRDAAPPAGALFSVDCDACRVDAYVRPRAPPPQLPVTKAIIGEGGTVGRIGPPYSGEARALALVADGRGLAYAAPPCAVDPAGGWVHRVEAQAQGGLQVTRTAGDLGCGPGRMLPDPSGGGALLLGRTATAAFMLRLDAQGRVVTRIDIPSDPFTPYGMAADAEADRVAAVLGPDRGDERDEARIVLLRLSDLATVAETSVIAELRGGTTFPDRDTFFASTSDLIQVFEAETGRWTGSFIPSTGERPRNAIHEFVAFPGGLVVGVSSSNRSGIHVLAGASSRGSSVFFERRAVLTDAVHAPSPGDAGAPGIVAGFTCPAVNNCSVVGTEAFLARFSAAENRFTPRPLGIVGRGPVVDLQRAPDGALWAVLPGEGAIVRIELTGS